MWTFAEKHGFKEELKKLHQPSLIFSFSTLLIDWIIITLCIFCLPYIEYGFYPFIFLLIGSRQLAIGNMIHEASHWNIDRNKFRADLVANICMCYPMLTNISRYRAIHLMHHRYLGCDDSDAEILHDENETSESWISLYAKHFFDLKEWFVSLIGQMHMMGWSDRAPVILWWLIFFLSLSLTVGLTTALVFIGVWYLCKGTTFHAMRIFREISDHVGLSPGSLLTFTRNHPENGILRFILHPHNNGYHIAHHLVPGVPFYALPKAHGLLMQWDDYRQAQHCDRYFWGGTAPAVTRWVKLT